jgi:hypothetical protein
MFPLLCQFQEICLFGHIMDPGHKTHQKFEWGPSCGGAGPGIMNILHQQKVLHLVVLLEVSIDTQVLFQPLVGSL